MLKLFKRIAGIPAPQPAIAVKRKPPSSRAAPLAMRDDSVLPDVVEGNSAADWELWQDSVDSQMQGLRPQVNPYPQTVPAALDDIDPFSRVGKNRDA